MRRLAVIIACLIAYGVYCALGILRDWTPKLEHFVIAQKLLPETGLEATLFRTEGGVAVSTYYSIAIYREGGSIMEDNIVYRTECDDPESLRLRWRGQTLTVSTGKASRVSKQLHYLMIGKTRVEVEYQTGDYLQARS